MTGSLELAAFLSRVAACHGEAVRDRYAAFAELEPVLRRLVGEAEVADRAGFLAEVASRLDPEAAPERALGPLRARDLALAIACTAGDPAAIARFERELFDEVDRAHARFRNTSLTRDELRQAMRDRLFVAAGEARPRIASYQGRGDLRAWVRMATTRFLVDVVRADSARPDRPGGDEALADVATPSDDPELAFLKRQYREDFRLAFRVALAELKPRDRNILRHRYLDGLEVGELAALYGIHRVSMSRTLSRIRDALLSSIRRELLRRLGLAASELDSLVALIASRLELSLSGLLRS